MQSEPISSTLMLAAAPTSSLRGAVNVFERLPQSLHAYVVAQRYDHYTANEHDVWCTIVEQYSHSSCKFAHRIYEPHLAGLAAMKLDRSSIPSIESINARLAHIGWMTACVDGYLPTRVYAGLIAHKVFPLSRGIRHREHISFSPTPDLVHDIFGHLPLLFDRQHRTYLRLLADATYRAGSNDLDDALHLANRRMGALKCNPRADSIEARDAVADVDRVQRALMNTPSEMTELARMFLWSIEFGLIGTRDDYKVHGAGLLSSLGETASLFEPGVRVEPYSIAVTKRDIHFSDFQNQYHVFPDYGTLTDVLIAYQNRTRSTSE